MRDELRNPKVLKKLGELKSAGMSWVAIKQTLERELGIKANISTIQGVYKIYASRSSEIIAGDDELKGALKQAVFDTAERLKKIGRIMDELLDQARTSAGDKISASKEILNQLYFQEKLLNNIQQGFDWGKINKIEYTKISVNNLEELEKAGYIKILKRPGEVIDVENIKEAEFEEEEKDVQEGNEEHNDNDTQEQGEGNSGGVQDSKERRTQDVLSDSNISKESEDRG